MHDEGVIRSLYAGFNQRDIPAVLELLATDVAWANGLEGGHVHGRDAVRAYWTAQWAAIQPQVEPLRIAERAPGVLEVDVHQVVHDLDGRLLLDEAVRHVFHLQAGRVARFDIENAGGLSAVAHQQRA